MRTGPLTPDQEARRLAAFRKAVCGKPVSEETKKKLSDSLKARWASGTRKRNPEQAWEKMGDTLRSRYANGTLKRPELSKELREQIGRSVSKALKGKPPTRSEPWTKDQRKRMRERVLENPKTGPGILNVHARTWRIRSPVNKVYEFRNLQMFIRENPHLFHPDDVIWNRSHGKACAASRGIQILSHRKKFPVGSWKGWTWYSHFEELVNNRQDLLQRYEVWTTKA